MAAKLALGDRVTTHCYGHFGAKHDDSTRSHSIGTITYVGKGRDQWVGITWDVPTQRGFQNINARPFQNQLPKRNLEKVGEPCTNSKCWNRPGGQNNREAQS